MPLIFKIGAYWVFFWTNESLPLEPVHVHVSIGAPMENATKIWITRRGKCLLCHNRSKIPPTHPAQHHGDHRSAKRRDHRKMEGLFWRAPLFLLKQSEGISISLPRTPLRGIFIPVARRLLLHALRRKVSLQGDPRLGQQCPVIQVGYLPAGRLLDAAQPFLQLVHGAYLTGPSGARPSCPRR